MDPLFAPLDLPSGVFLLITDELAAPGDFFLHRTLASYLKRNKNGRAIIVALSESTTRWKALASKSNVNLAAHIESGTVVIIDAEQESCMSASTIGDLKSIFERVRAALQDIADEDERPLLILDDIALLEWTGSSSMDVSRLVRSLRSLCLKKHATFIARLHLVTPTEPEELFRLILPTCSYHLEVKPLASGRSGEVSGEVALHAGFSSAALPGARIFRRDSALQYKMTEIGAEFFERGTSQGVL